MLTHAQDEREFVLTFLALIIISRHNNLLSSLFHVGVPLISVVDTFLLSRPLVTHCHESVRSRHLVLQSLAKTNMYKKGWIYTKHNLF